jgi:lipopolysaccharide/colanic/teichoic acid biosynthesis glycosyltransferase
MDILASILALAMLLPVLLVISVLIAVVDGRPIFFGQTRVGRFGRHFTMYKFRSMVPDAE